MDGHPVSSISTFLHTFFAHFHHIYSFSRLIDMPIHFEGACCRTSYFPPHFSGPFSPWISVLGIRCSTPAPMACDLLPRWLGRLILDSERFLGCLLLRGLRQLAIAGTPPPKKSDAAISTPMFFFGRRCFISLVGCRSVSPWSCPSVLPALVELFTCRAAEGKSSANSLSISCRTYPKSCPSLQLVLNRHHLQSNANCSWSSPIFRSKRGSGSMRWQVVVCGWDHCIAFLWRCTAHLGTRDGAWADVGTRGRGCSGAGIRFPIVSRDHKPIQMLLKLRSSQQC